MHSTHELFPLLLFVPDFIVGTVHKAKGLEFDTVMVTDDFAKVPGSRHNLHFRPDFSFGTFPSQRHFVIGGLLI